MLSLKNIIKDYPVGDGVVHALKGVDVEFRKMNLLPYWAIWLRQNDPAKYNRRT